MAIIVFLAVRFGRVPKKEKARIIEQMQKKNLASQSSELNSLLSNDLDIVQAVVTAHCHTCDITQFRAYQMRDVALMKQEYINCPANMVSSLALFFKYSKFSVFFLVIY